MGYCRLDIYGPVEGLDRHSRSARLSPGRRCSASSLAGKAKRVPCLRPTQVRNGHSPTSRLLRSRNRCCSRPVREAPGRLEWLAFRGRKRTLLAAPGPRTVRALLHRVED